MKVAAIVLTGFLGAGKTTLLNRAIARRAAGGGGGGGKLGIIVNELGAIGVDGDLLPRGAARQVELPGGCVCCVLNEDLDRTVREMLDGAPDIDTLVIETTGVAEPLPIVWALEEPPLGERLRVAAVVAVVDPTSFAGARQASPTAEIQVEHADVILLSKADVADPETLGATRAAVATLAPAAPCVEGTLDERAAWLLDLLRDPPEVAPGGRAARPAAPPGRDEHDRQADHDHDHAEHADHADHADHPDHAGPGPAATPARHGIDAVAVAVDALYDLEELEDALGELPPVFVRVKGLVRAVDPRDGHDAPPRWVAIHRVGTRVSSEPVPPPAGGGRVVALGPGVTDAVLRAGLARAVLSSEPGT